MKKLLVIVLLALSSSVARGAEESGGFRLLFNGKDLNGWVRVNTAPSTWTVREGMLICSGKPIGELRTDRMYQNFILELEWRHMVPKGNAGVFVWADDITAKGVPFHRSIEVQVLENAYGNGRGHTTHGDIFPIHGAKMTPINGRGGSRAFPTENRSKPSPQWNHYRITCQDGAISLAVNGKVVTRGTDCSLRKGYICLESEGGIVHYRNLRIKELPATPLSPEHIAIADRGYRSLYTGLDLTGWKTGAENRNRWQTRDWVLAYEGTPSDEHVSLSTEESFADFGFVFDVRRKETSGDANVLLRGSAKAEITIETDGKSWNRYEGTLRGDRLTLRLNGKLLFSDKQLAGVPSRGPLTLTPTGQIEFANLYVRSLNGVK